jgi:hypothetical protein
VLWTKKFVVLLSWFKILSLGDPLLTLMIQSLHFLLELSTMTFLGVKVVVAGILVVITLTFGFCVGVAGTTSILDTVGTGAAGTGATGATGATGTGAGIGCQRLGPAPSGKATLYPYNTSWNWGRSSSTGGFVAFFLPLGASLKPSRNVQTDDKRNVKTTMAKIATGNK